MTLSIPVEQVVKCLEEGGYTTLSDSLSIAGVSFRFPAVLIGPQRSSDLVLVADTASEVEDVFMARQVLSVARALDVVEKCNPLTTVIVGPRPDQELISDMMRVSRVLAVGPLEELDSEAEFSPLRNWLAVLLPLNLRTENISFDPLDRLRKDLKDELRPELMGIFEASNRGQAAVAKVVNELIVSELVEIKDDES